MRLNLEQEDIDAIAARVAELVFDKLSQERSGSTQEKLLTESEAAAILRVQTHTLRDARRRGALKCQRVGRFPRYRREDLDEWLASSAQRTESK